MDIVLHIVSGIAGIAMLYYGAEFLIKGGVSIALKLKVSAHCGKCWGECAYILSCLEFLPPGEQGCTLRKKQTISLELRTQAAS